MMKTLNLILPDSIRSKKNSKRIFSMGKKFKKVLPSKAYLEWEEAARISVRAQIGASYPGFQMLTCPVLVNALIYFKGPQPDLSGCLESIGDCLEGIIWKNDRQIESWDGSRLTHDLKNPRTLLIISWEDRVFAD